MGDFHDGRRHCEADVERVVTCIYSHHPKHVKSALTRKHKPYKGNASIQLCIRKLDNTSFALAVPKNATVKELKRVLQSKFDSSGCNISWPHVWGNFCLSFNNQKLLDNGKHLNQLGISNGNELQFVQHMTTSSSQWDCQRQGFFTSMRRKRSVLMQRNL
ncbi:hypothetical protein GOP47_0021638 [Adiantum capillus-veneris]|uniref:SNRNP25 ubiquitin-like domain-containing protein n=1 Tax=Adiantum capillus-veneris TaxID=13818 RepID=A0A9D4U9Z7_ADICA|nr:hypothetical protein GOP47_0021638 [Adiantum capillus-veneris]